MEQWAVEIIEDLGQKARSSAFALSQADDLRVNAALADIEQSLLSKTDDLLSANRLDLEAAAGKNLPEAMMDRLTLTRDRIVSMARGVRVVMELENPCGKVLEEWVQPNGLRFQKISVPIGVLGMIYESRPNVTVDAAALSLKSRNAIILRGGSESFHSSVFLHGLIEEALVKNDLPAACVGMVKNQDRALVGAMLGAAGLIDVIIPRGGKGLTGRVMAEARMPVFAHLNGNCHVYIDASARPDMALSIVRNAKLRRTGICGAAESLLFDEKADPVLRTQIVKMLLDEGVQIMGDEQARTLDPRVSQAAEEDWSAEYLEKKISCKHVHGVMEAVAHINRYGSHHTDCIVTEDGAAAAYFLANTDSAIVLHNASTQFADGGEFGFGAEIGIGTGKLHARGPVGVRQLTTFKYKVLGDGQIRP